MIELAEVISELRSELDRARTSGTDDGLRFELGPIDLEVTVGLEKKGGAGAKVRFYVIELGGEGELTSTTTQRIRLTLKPTLPVDNAIKQHEQRVNAYVGGASMTDER